MRQKVRYGLALASAVLLTGCVTNSVLSELPFVSSINPRVSVLDKSMTITGPLGYCPDLQTVKEVDGSAHVLVGPCLTIGKVARAAIAISVGPPGSGAVMAEGGEALSDFFTSDQGRQTLSGRAKADDVEILSAQSQDEMFLMHVYDAQTGENWRAMLAARGRLITIGINANGLPAEDGLDLAAAAARAMKKANPQNG